MRLLVAILILAACGCPGPKYPQPSGMGDSAAVIAKLGEARSRAKTFRAEAISDYWIGKDRIKGAVLMMATPEAKLRFNGLSPAGEDVLLDLACNGADYVYVNKQENCQLVGPCNGESIAQLLHVPLEPDDFFYLALGMTPVMEGATGKVTWDGKKGQEVLELKGTGGSQTVVIDARDGRFDVLKSELRDGDGKLVWSVEHKDYGDVQGQDNPATRLRLPGKSRFQSGREKSDAIVEWKKWAFNLGLPAQGFTLAPVDGLPTCGAAAPAAKPKR